MRAIKFVPVLAVAIACSPRHYALKQVADAISGNGEGGAFSRDDDPELVRDAVPFALKTMESLADKLPGEDPGLRLGLASGFTQYGYGFVQQPAELRATPDLEQIARARKLYLRARQYGLDGLKIQRGITEDQLRGKDRDAALAKLTKEDVPLVYWTLVPWAAAIAANKRDLSLVGDLPAIAAMLDRALVLDDTFDHGALHEFSITFDSARSGGTTPEKQKQHFDRAMALSGGLKVSPLVTYAQEVAAPAQDKKQYVALLKQADGFDVDKPEARGNRLANVLAQRRARYLLAHVDDVFSD